MTTNEPDGIEILDIDDPEAGLLAYAIGGNVTEEQAQQVFDRIKAAAEEGRKVRIFYDIHGFPTAPPMVLVEKLKNLGKILKSLERVAFVGDQMWLAGYSILLKLTPFDFKSFKRAKRDEAVAWIRE